MLDKKLQSVIINMQNQKNQARREELYWKKRQFVSEKLSKWQKIQTHKMIVKTKNDAFSVASRSIYFNRVRRLDSSRDRFAFSLFFHVSLRSPQGRTAFQNMITLCTNNPSMAYCTNLKPKNDYCPITKCARKMKKYAAFLFHFRFDYLDWLWYSIDITFKWNHIYHCYKADFINKYNFAELCFQCDKWFTNNLEWHKHCHNHFENFEIFSI